MPHQAAVDIEDIDGAQEHPPPGELGSAESRRP